MKLYNDEIRFEVTNRCNAECIMCPREKMTRTQGILDFDLFKRILNEAVDLGVKNVTLENFGESFLDPYIFDRAKHAKSKNLNVYTVTNASLLDEEKIEKVLDLFDRIRISMYGMTKETYEAIHRGLHFEKTKRNIEKLFYMRKIRNSKIKIDIYFLLMEENKHQMNDFLKQYEEVADAISVWKPHNWADGRNYREIIKKLTTCGRPFSGPIQIQWNGQVVPCCFDYDSKIILGDLTKDSLKEIMKSYEFNKLREAHKNGNFAKYPLCEACDQLNKREDVLVYTNIKNAKVGAIYSTNLTLDAGANGQNHIN